MLPTLNTFIWVLNQIVLINENFGVSHYYWKTKEELILYLNNGPSGKGYYCVTDKTKFFQKIKELPGQLDGHPSTNQTGSILITDTVCDKFSERSLIAFNFSSSTPYILHSFFSPSKYTGELRCDLHPRLSPDGKYIAVDNSYLGYRTMSVLDFSEAYNKISSGDK